MRGMKTLTPALLALALAAPAAAALAAEPIIEPGCWESTNRVTSPIRTTSTTQKLITPADVDRFLTGPINHHYTCDYPTHRVADGKLVMKGVCTDRKGRQVKISTRGTYTRTSFRVEADFATTLLGIPLSGHGQTDARRIGDACPVAEGGK
jgi:hypothetical protein